MAAIIPFVGKSRAVQRLALDVFNDVEIYRVTGDALSTLDEGFSSRDLWIDPAIEGLDSLIDPTQNTNSGWGPYILSFPGAEKISDPSFQRTPEKAVVEEFVESILDHVSLKNPAWLTVPQLPQSIGASRNKINLLLAKATGAWRLKKASTVKLITPLIFCKSADYGGVPLRRAKVDHLLKVFAASSSTGVWVVDSGMDDIGPETMKGRYEGLIALHEEIRDRLQPAMHVAGPYWVANLLLFARGIITNPAALVGANSQFHLSSCWLPPRPESIKVLLKSLRRKVSSAEISPWLAEAATTLGGSHPASAEFDELRMRLRASSPDWSRDAITKFYRWWFDLIEQAPPESRGITLFQDATTAYALGKKLHLLPKTEKSTRRPEATVAPLLTTCL